MAKLEMEQFFIVDSILAEGTISETDVLFIKWADSEFDDEAWAKVSAIYPSQYVHTMTRVHPGGNRIIVWKHTWEPKSEIIEHSSTLTDMYNKYVQEVRDRRDRAAIEEKRQDVNDLAQAIYDFLLVLSRELMLNRISLDPLSYISHGSKRREICDRVTEFRSLCAATAEKCIARGAPSYVRDICDAKWGQAISAIGRILNNCHSFLDARSLPFSNPIEFNSYVKMCFRDLIAASPGHNQWFYYLYSKYKLSRRASSAR